MNKRTFLGLAICVLVIASASFLAFDDRSDATSKYFYSGLVQYEICSEEDLTVRTVKGSYNHYNDEKNPLVIPPTVENDGKTYTVVEIGKYTFEGQTGLKSITLPNTLQRIDSWAFHATNNSTPGLRSIDIPDSVTEIGTSAFNGCSYLTDVRLSPNVKYLVDCFIDCERLQYIEIPEGVKTLSQTFDGCKNLETVILPTSLEKIYDLTFNDCEQLRYLYLPENVCKVDWNSSFDKTGLELIEVSENNPNFKSENNLILTKDGKTVVYCPPIVENIIVPEGVENIGTPHESFVPFKYCYDLKSITFPSTLKFIGNSFEWCTSIERMEIPDNVTEIGYSAFSYCTGLKEITLPKNLKKIGPFAFKSCYSLDNVIIPWGVESVGNSAFSGCRSLKNLEFPDTVTDLGNSIFDYCSSLRGARLPDGIQIVGSDMFRGCTSLRSVVIPEGVVVIEDGAFTDCDSLTSIEFPNTLQSLPKKIVNSIQQFHDNEGNIIFRYSDISDIEKIRGRTFTGDCWNMFDAGPSHPGEYGICFKVDEEYIYAYSAKAGEIIVPPKSPVKIENGYKEYAFECWKASDGSILQPGVTVADHDVVYEAKFATNSTSNDIPVNFLVGERIVTINVPSSTIIDTIAPRDVDKVIATDSGRTYLFLGWYDADGNPMGSKRGYDCAGENITFYPCYEEIGNHGVCDVEYSIKKTSTEKYYTLSSVRATELSSAGKGLLIDFREYKAYQAYLAIPADVISSLVGKETTFTIKSDIEPMRWTAEISVTQDGTPVTGLDGKLSLIHANNPTPTEKLSKNDIVGSVGGKTIEISVVTEVFNNEGANGYSIVGEEHTAIHVNNYNRFSEMKVGPGKWEIQSYRTPHLITLIVDGKVYRTIQTGSNGLVYLPNGPIKPNEGNTHYIFDKWVFACNGNDFNTSSTINSGIKLVAKYNTEGKSPEGRYITFNANGGHGKMETMFIPKGTSIVLPKNTFSKAGHTFMGWIDNTNVEYNDMQTIPASESTDNIILKAKWSEPQEFKLRIVYVGPTKDGKFVAPAEETVNVKAGHTYTVVSPESSMHHYLKPKDLDVTMPGHDITVYRFYTSELFNITYVGINASNYPDLKTFRSYSSEVVLQKTAPTIGCLYYSNSEMTNEITKIERFTKEITIYVKIKPTIYTISFDGNGADSGHVDTIQNTGEAITLPPSGFIRENYEFVGWGTSPDGKNRIYNGEIYPGIICGPNVRTTLYAIWKHTSEHTVTVNIHGPNDGKFEIPSSLPSPYTFKCRYEESVSKDVFEYIFITNEDGTKTEYRPEYKSLQFKMPDHDVNLDLYYYNYTNNHYVGKVSYYNCGSDVDNVENVGKYCNERPSYTLKNPSREGYVFGGWFSDSTFNTPITTIDTSVEKTYTVYAKWIPLEKNIIVNYIHPDGWEYVDAASTKTFTHKVGSEYSHAFPAYRGYYATITSPEYVGILKYSSISGEMPVHDFTVTVEYHPVDWNIRYYLNGGENNLENVPDHTHKESFEFKDPTRRDGIAFLGWFSDPGFTKRITSIPAGTMENTRVYAKWDVIPEFNVIVKLEGPDDGTFQEQHDIVKTYQVGEEFTITIPSIVGYTPDVRVVSGTMASSDIEVKVTYSANIHKVTVKANIDDITTPTGWIKETNGTFSKEFAYAQPIDLSGFNIEGYDLVLSPTPEKMEDSDMIFNAEYTKKTYSITFIIGDPKDPKGAYYQKTIYVEHGERIVLPDDLPSQEGYVIVWNQVIPEVATENMYFWGRFALPVEHTLIVNITYEGGEEPKEHTSKWMTGATYTVDLTPYLGDKYTCESKLITGIMPDYDVSMNVKCSFIRFEIIFESRPVVENMPSTQYLLKGELVKDPGELVCDGHTFLGWYNGAEKYDFTKPVESNLILMARWGSSMFKVYLPTGDGYRVEVLPGYDANQIPYGEGLKFKIVLYGDYDQSTPVVNVEDSIIPRINGVYTIENVTSDLYVNISGIVLNPLSFFVNLPTGDGYRAEVLPGYDAYQVPYGEDLKFKIVLYEDYDQSTPVVTVGNSIIPQINGVYTIDNVTSDMYVNISGITLNPSQGGSSDGDSENEYPNTPSVPEVKTDPDGTKTTTEINNDGSTTETVEKPDGSTIVKTTEIDGSFKEVSTDADGSKKESTHTKTENGTVETEKTFDATGKVTGSVEKKTETLNSPEGNIISKTEKTLDSQGKSEINKSLESEDGSMSISIKASIDDDNISLETEVSLDITPGTEATEAVEKALNLMESEIKKDVTENKADTTHSLKINTNDKEAKLSPESFAKISDLGMSVAFELDNGIVEFDSGAAKRLSGHTDAVNISMAPVDMTKLSDEIKDIVGDKPAFEISAGSSSSKVHDLSGTAKITVSYNPPSGVSASDIRVFYVDDDGVRHMMETTFDEATGKVSFFTPHFSLYMIGTVEDAPASDSGISTWVYVIIAVIAVIAVAAVVMYKKS